MTLSETHATQPVATTDDRLAEFERLLAAALRRILAPTDPAPTHTADAPIQAPATTLPEETHV